MARNFGEGVKRLTEVGLDGFATANKLWACLVTQAEADVDPTMGLASLTQVGGTASKTGCSCVLRTIDMGALTFSGDCSTAKAVVITDGDPTSGTSKAIEIQDINTVLGVAQALGAGAATGYTCDGLSMLFPYRGEA